MEAEISSPWTVAFPLVPEWLPETQIWWYRDWDLGAWCYQGFEASVGGRHRSGWSVYDRSPRPLYRLHRDLAVAYAGRCLPMRSHPHWWSMWDTSRWSAWERDDVYRTASKANLRPGEHENVSQRRLLTLGIPRRWDRRWVSQDARALAQDMHDRWDFAGMPILADMLEERGCEDGELLRWCRELPTHCWYRGAWVLVCTLKV